MINKKIVAGVSDRLSLAPFQPHRMLGLKLLLATAIFNLYIINETQSNDEIKALVEQNHQDRDEFVMNIRQVYGSGGAISLVVLTLLFMKVLRIATTR